MLLNFLLNDTTEVGFTPLSLNYTKNVPNGKNTSDSFKYLSFVSNEEGLQQLFPVSLLPKF